MIFLRGMVQHGGSGAIQLATGLLFLVAAVEDDTKQGSLVSVHRGRAAAGVLALGHDELPKISRDEAATVERFQIPFAFHNKAPGGHVLVFGSGRGGSKKDP